QRATLCARREPRLSGNTDHASRVDDSRRRPNDATGSRRNNRWTGAALRWFRGSGRSDSRSVAGTRPNEGRRVMQNEKRIIVLKFGSSVLRSENDLPAAVHEIYRWWRDGFQVVAVVSAFGNTTDELTQRALSVCEQPDDDLVAALLSTGESTSSVWLGLALNRSGIPASVLDAEQAGLSTDGPVLDADLTSVNTGRVLKALKRGVVVLPGFVGKSPSGKTTLLGRG